jgi:ribosomal protein S18 acetylase RimI-like enzyme
LICKNTIFIRFAPMIIIRKAIVKDITRIVEFQQIMALETESLHLVPEVLLKGIDSVFADPAKGFYLVAETDQTVVACTMLTPEWSDWRNGTFLWIQSVYVDPAYRQKGIYSKMYSFVKNLVLNSPEYLGLRLYVVMNNKVAQEVYSRTGMDGDHYKLYEWVK